MPKIAGAACAAAATLALACAAPPTEVQGVRPARRDLESVLETNGRVAAAGAAAVHAAVAGRVARVLAARGSTVERGRTLVQLEDEGLAAARAQAEARLDAARARLAHADAGLAAEQRAKLEAERKKQISAFENAARESARLERLVNRAAAPRLELETQQRVQERLAFEIEALDAQLAERVAPERRRVLEAECQEAEASLREVERKLDRLTVRAPLAGTVYSVPVANGDALRGGDLVARIRGLGPPRVRILVDEPDLGRIGMGSVARITADAYAGRTWNCTVDGAPTEIRELGARRVGEALCTLSDPDELLLPGLAVGVRIVAARAVQALSVPRAAIRFAGGRAHVWVPAEGRAQRRPVRLGVQTAVHAQVVEGLAAAETVLLPGDLALADGQRIQVRSETVGGHD